MRGLLTLASFSAYLIVFFCPTFGHAAAIGVRTCSALFESAPWTGVKVTPDTIGFANDYRVLPGLQGDRDLYYTRLDMYRIGETEPHSHFKNLVRDKLTQKVLPDAKPLGRPKALKPVLHDPGLAAIYANYGTLVNPATVRLVVKIERELPLSRQSTYLVNGLGNGTTLGKAPILGFMRVFDGSAKFRASGRYSALPLERILKASGQKTDAIAAYREQGLDVLEIGKYFLNSELSPSDHHAVRKSVLVWLRNRIRDHEGQALDKTYYFTHVVSRVHQIAYQRSYGFKIADRSLTENLAADENILFIRADELLAKLNQIIGE